MTLKPRLLEGSRYTDGTVTYNITYIHLDDRITKPDIVMTSPTIYEENATVGPLTLRFSKGNNDFEMNPLRFQFNIMWALKKDCGSLPGCVIDPRSEKLEEKEKQKEIQSSLLIIYSFKDLMDRNM